MTIATDFTIVIIGAAIILATAHFSVKYALRLAKAIGLSETFIGMTVLSIGTSLPEIITHIVGSVKILTEPETMNQVSGLVVGTNIGSDIFQQNFLIGVVALVGAVVVTKKHRINNIGGLILAAVIIMVMSLNGWISQIEGALLVILYGLFLWHIKKKGLLEEEEIDHNYHNGILKSSIMLIILFAAMAITADFVVEASTHLIQVLPISASFFGIILLGIAAALPELTTSIISVLQGKHKISGGILIGSNITNPMLALGIGAMISGYTVPTVVYWFDLPFKIITALLILLFFWKDVKLKKLYAAILVILYIAYVIVRNIYFPADIF